jgi:hypothetical protein
MPKAWPRQVAVFILLGLLTALLPLNARPLPADSIRRLSWIDPPTYALELEGNLIRIIGPNFKRAIQDGTYQDSQNNSIIIVNGRPTEYRSGGTVRLVGPQYAKAGSGIRLVGPNAQRIIPDDGAYRSAKGAVIIVESGALTRAG